MNHLNSMRLLAFKYTDMRKLQPPVITKLFYGKVNIDKILNWYLKSLFFLL